MNGKKSPKLPVIFFFLREKAPFYLSFLLTVVIFFSPQIISSQSDENSLPGEIQWKTSLPAISSVSGDKLDTILDKAPSRHIVIQFEKPVTGEIRENLENSGISLLSYLGNNGYFANVSGKPGIVEAARKQGAVKASEIYTEWKLDPIINSGNIPSYALFRSDNPNTPLMENPEDADIAVLYIVFHPDVNLEPDGIEILERHCCMVQDLIPVINAALAFVPLDGIRNLADEDAVQWIEAPNPPLTETNDSNRVITQVNDVQASPYNLNGSGIDVLVFDGGQVGNHVDFGTRLTHGDSSDVSEHATHVAGTVGGSGANSINEGGTANEWKGMAPSVDIISYGIEFSGYLDYIFYDQVGDLEADYTQAINTYGADIANNSLGSNVYWNYYPSGCVIVGKYGVTSVLLDGIIRGSLGSPFRIVWAAGNERGWSTSCNYNYNTITPPAAAKNSIVVGGVNSNNDTPYSHSSWGPTQDGRTKPDICGPACQTSGDYGVTSTDNDPVNSYTTKCGTSMASPSVTGICALIMQDWKAQFSTSVLPSNSMLKALLAHNAEDKGNAGPDYSYGYGSVRAKDTIDFMRTGRFVEESVIQGTIKEYFLHIPEGETEIKATLAWDDPPGTYNCNPTLINNLDLLVKDPDGTNWRPYILNPSNPSNTATRGVDNRNNLEQVVVPNPDPGVWRIRVYGTLIPLGPQMFSLAMSHDRNLNTPGEITLDKFAYAVNEKVDITVIDPDMNQNKSTPDFISVIIASDTEPGGELLYLQETGADTSEFTGGIFLSQQLLVTPGDTITAIYNDVYSQDSPSRTLRAFAMVIGPDIPLVVDTIEDYMDWGRYPFHLPLRMAIAAIPDDYEITFDPGLSGGTITLDPELGELVIQKNVTITGLGVDQLKISGGDAVRVFYISDANVNMRDVSIIHGNSNINSLNSSHGAGIYISDLSVQPVVILEDCVINDNTADGNGGGIYNNGGDLTMNRCRISHNQADILGGGIFNDGTLQMSACLVSFNTLVNLGIQRGGGIYNNPLETLQMTNCTVSSNVASTYIGTGGGLQNYGQLTMIHCSFTGNHASNEAGGLRISSGTSYILGSLFAGNTTGDLGPDVYYLGGDLFSDGTNLVGDPAGSEGFWLPTDILDVPASEVIDPILRDSGGPTLTHALILGSPAVNAIPFTSCTLALDQRGISRPQSLLCDIGAYEALLNLTVDNFIDEDDGDYSSGDLSLREAIKIIAPGGTITFPEPGGSSISLSDPNILSFLIILDPVLGDLVIDKNLIISGPGKENLTISGNNSTRVFFIKSQIVTIRDLKIENGSASGGNGGEGGGGAGGMGGAIFVNTGAHLMLENVDFFGNEAIGGAGGTAGFTGGGGGGAGVSGNGGIPLGINGANGGTGDPFGGIPGSGGAGGLSFPYPSTSGAPGGNGGEGTGGGGGGRGSNGFGPQGSGHSGGNGGSGGFGGGGGKGGNGGNASGLAPGGPGGNGGSGGFGAGGGAGGVAGIGLPSSGGFGGNSAGFGGKGGNAYQSAYPSGGGGGGGLGGAIFVRQDAKLSLTNCCFDNNTATGGAAGSGGYNPSYFAEPGLGKGGAIFIQNGALVFNKGGLSFSANEATDDLGYINDNDNVYGMTLTGDVLVTILPDEDDGNYAPDDLSLREAISAVGIGGTITFDPALFTPTGTIILNNSLHDLVINKDMNIQGSGADILSVNGNAYQRIFRILDGNTRISGMTITNGNDEDGGGVFVGSDAALVIDSCSVSDNTAYERGGGIFNEGNLGIYNTTISGNSAVSISPITFGGGICNMANLKMTNCTLSGNSALYNYGGGIAHITGILEMTNCTVTANSAPDAGGIYNSDGIAFVKNSIAAGNTSGSANPDVLGNFNSNGYNIIGNTSGSSGWLSSDITGIGVSSAIDTILQDNGGPTKTHAVIPCGPAFDGGNDDEITTPTFLSPPYTDQRGMPRISHNAVDIGAFEIQPSAPAIEVSPAFLDFGIYFLNQGPSAPQSITITNTGTADLAFNSFDFSPDFYFAPNQDTSNLEVCMSRSLDIVFDPSSLGLITGILDINTNDPIIPTVTIDLQGIGFNLPPMAVACEADNISLDFQQTYDRVFLRNYYNFPTTEYTVSFWMNCSDLTRDSSIFSYAVYGRDNELLLYFYLNQLRILHKGGAIQTGVEFKDGLWHHVAVTWRSLDGQIKVYKDGQDVFTGTIGLFSSLTTGGTIVLGEDQDCVGGCFQSSQAYIGILDEIRLWNIARSKDDIQQDMNRTLQGDEPGLVGYWKCDEGEGTVIYDLSPYGYNGTLSGYPDWSTNTPDLIYYDNFITVDENTDSTITLCGIDPDADPLTGIITQLPDPGIGELYQFAGEGPVRGVIIDTVPAIISDPLMRVVYVSVDTTINYQEYMKYKVNDGYEDSSNEASYTITVLDNDPPILVNNVPQSLAKGDILYYTSDTLYATDFEDIPENIIYALTNPPMHGTLWINGTELEQDETFTQADIDAGMLSYMHSSIGMAGENFSYDLMDGAGLVSGPFTTTIDILFTPAPQVYVDLNSPGPVLDGGSWASAHHSLRIGVLDAEALGLTEVWVADGTYMEAVDMRSGVHALSGFEGYGGAEETMASQRDWLNNICIVEGPEHGRAFTLGDISNSLIHGFVVTGTGISCNGSDDTNLIAHCLIRENTAQFGAGIFMNGSSVKIADCTFMDNAAIREGGGIYMRNGSEPIITHCFFSGNTAEEEGGALYLRNKDEPRIVNSIIAFNEATYGGAMYVRQNSIPLLINCTISGNTAVTAGGGIFCDNDGTPIASNTIFEGNNNFAIYEGNDMGNASLINCLFWENMDGAFRNSDGFSYIDEDVDDLNNDIPEAMNNITGDPRFMDKSAGNFHIRMCSSALDEGIPNQAPLDDKDGNIRPNDLPGIGKDGPDQGFDIGAYELYTTGTKIVVMPLLVPFGNQPINQGPTDPQIVTILNEGLDMLEIDSIEFDGVGAFFLTDPLDESDMAICEDRLIGIVFDPSEIGPTTGTLVIRSGDMQNPEITVVITGTGVNTPPVAGIPGPGGDQFTANTDEDTAIVITATGYDVDGDELTAWVTQIPEAGKGGIYQYEGSGPIPGIRITSVPTQVTDSGWRLVYIPDDAAASYDAIVKWKMNDGSSDSLNEGTYTITVQAVDEPAVLVNSSMTIVEGATQVVTSSHLLATGDYPLIYRINNLPSYGELLLNSASLSLNDTFTQEDITLGLLQYAHDGSEEASDSVGISFQDLNSGWITGNTFTITVILVNDPPILAWNRSLLVDEGGIGSILQTHLLVQDEETIPSEIIYTVGTFPVNGDLFLNGSSMSPGGIETFTQADIDAGLLSYIHGGGSMDPDEFTFTFTDGVYVIGPDTFTITISFSDRKGAWWMMR